MKDSLLHRLLLGPDESALTGFFLSAMGHADRITFNHSVMVAQLAETLCDAMRLNGKTPEIVLAALLHDIGKIGIEGRFLAHNGPLEPDEQQALRAHTTLGGQALARMFERDTVTLVARHHHERYDGKGYPAGLSGGEIPLAARIVGLVDAYDAIRASRPYSPPCTHDDAVARLVSGRGTHFDPVVIDAFAKSDRQVAQAYDQIRTEPAYLGARTDRRAPPATGPLN
ncbi:MAG: HD domain-containing protein [Rhodospirillaceae bacterium]|nr:HD domain-containing protein [Rhodospirillaceae bacterium]